MSDLMTGLMMFFLMIAVFYMQQIQMDKKKVEKIAASYQDLRSELHDDLQKEFSTDLPKWHAELGTDLTISFKEPEVLFDSGSSVLKPRFTEILSDFFPRYVRILTEEKYRDSIQEIRIEGHTSSFWRGALSPDDAYFKNMELSQARTRTTLQYVLTDFSVSENKSWLMQHLTANGLSSSRHILAVSGEEDTQLSQRVEFRVKTNADQQLQSIVQTMKYETH
ncbi:MAG: OmpA family protein [Phycisphaerae bacterium]|nr:OmpA family protein [Phycisphaerae bacterium]